MDTLVKSLSFIVENRLANSINFLGSFNLFTITDSFWQVSLNFFVSIINNLKSVYSLPLESKAKHKLRAKANIFSEGF